MAFDLPLITDQADVAIATKTADSLKALRDGSAIIGTGGGTANAQTVTCSPAFTALTNGLKIGYKPTVTNTGGMTIALDGLTAKSVLKRQAGALVALVAGDIVANIQAELTFVTQNDAWILDTPAQIVSADIVSLDPTKLSSGTIPAGVNIPTTQLNAGAVPSGVTIDAARLSGGTVPSPVVVPLARLSASAANSGYPQSGTGGETLRVIRGRVNSNGTIADGTGFTITKGGTGFYTINFTSSFSAVPSVTTAPYDSSQNTSVVVNTTVTVSTAPIKIFTTALADQHFMFIAIGPA